jgi:hypothetical protein
VIQPRFLKPQLFSSKRTDTIFCTFLHASNCKAYKCYTLSKQQYFHYKLITQTSYAYEHINIYPFTSLEKFYVPYHSPLHAFLIKTLCKVFFFILASFKYIQPNTVKTSSLLTFTTLDAKTGTTDFLKNDISVLKELSQLYPI